MPELSVVIPARGRHEVLRRAIGALREQTADRARFEVIVVSDAAEPEPGSVAAAAAPVGRALRATAAGASAARNIGWRAARAPLVLFLGADILADRTLVDEHLSFHTVHRAKEDAAVGHVRWADELPVTPLMTWLDDGIQADYRRLEAGAAPFWADFLTTNVSLKRGMLEASGGFDERAFPFLYEDVELGRRLEGMGLRLQYLASARAEHLHAPELAEWRSRMGAIARAERRWVELHPDLEPYFERRLRAARAKPPVPAVVARMAAPLARRDVPKLSVAARRLLDVHYGRRLAPYFLDAWDSA